MTEELRKEFDKLSPTQRQAVEWKEGAALILAGPGVGKTTVLTTRIASILDNSRDRKFRILALTFTTKAGDEMRSRVEAMVPGLTERTIIGTFHSFCVQMLRQHGSHLDIGPDFGVYDRDEDRVELLRDALRRAAHQGDSITPDEVRWLKAIDQLRRNLIGPQDTARIFLDPAKGERVARVHRIYEEALRQHNVMDFNGMILDTCRLVKRVPAVAARIRQSYPYWLVDEFQDTTPAQYRLLQYLAGDAFKNIFVVADDDQIMFQWAGASYKQITNFRTHFAPELMQLVENRYCPPQIVQAANRLIRHNSCRTPEKLALVSMISGNSNAVSQRMFSTDREEAEAIATEFAQKDKNVLGKSAVLGRTRAVLRPALEALQKANVPVRFSERRNHFVSPQFIWLQACLDLSVRPTNRQMFTAMVGAANRIANIELDAALLAAESESLGEGYLEFWAQAAPKDNVIVSRLSEFAMRLVQSRATWRRVVSDAVSWLPGTVGAEEKILSDADEDKVAWDAVTNAISVEKRDQLDLNEFLQGLALRSKEPPSGTNTIRLMTIHGAKGLEFENVWVMGVAESILPSWQSLKVDAKPTELEEERRNFFVAITRTQKNLVLSCARRYRDRVYKPSRFLKEIETNCT